MNDEWNLCKKKTTPQIQSVDDVIVVSILGAESYVELDWGIC